MTKMTGTKGTTGALASKRIVVTGGSRGIGRAIVERAARAGATVDFSFLSSAAAAAEIVATLSAEGASVAAHRCDLHGTAALEEMVGRIEEHRGGIDGLVNNAGVTLERLLLATTDEDIAATLAIDLVAPMVASRAVLGGMVRRRAGVIVNIGSSAAQRPVRGQSVYAAAKGALEAFTRALAIEVAPRSVRVLCVAPGPVRTDMLASALALDEAAVHALTSPQTGAITEPDEVARLVAFLLSDAAVGLTGQTLATDDDIVGYSRA